MFQEPTQTTPLEPPTSVDRDILSAPPTSKNPTPTQAPVREAAAKQAVDPKALVNDRSILEIPPVREKPQDFVPWGGPKTTARSQYLKGLTYQANPDYVKSINQGFWDETANGLAQAVVGMGLEMGQGASSLGIGDFVDAITGTETKFGNTMSNKFAEWNREFKDVVPVYQRPSTEGFSPNKWEWWAGNAPSIASAVALMFPARGATWLASKLLRRVGVVERLEKFGVGKAFFEGAEVLGMAGASRHMEGMMEGLEVFEVLKREALADGKSNEEAEKIAAEGASETYQKNWPLIVGDILQFGLAFKTYRSMARWRDEEKLTKSIMDKAGVRYATQAGTEGFEEAYQFTIGKEAERSAAIRNKLIEDDNTTYGERLMKYVADGDLQTAAFFGALGGATFEAIGSLQSRQLEKEKLKHDIETATVEKTIATYQEDPIKFARSSDTDIIKMSLAGIEEGRATKVEDFFKLMLESDIKSEDGTEVKQRAQEGLEDLHYLIETYDSIRNSATKADSIELTRMELANRARHKTDGRLLEYVKKEQGKALDTIVKESKLDPTYASLLQGEIELQLMEEEFADMEVDEDLKESRIKALKDQNKKIRDTIKTNSTVTGKQVTDAEIDKILDVDKNKLAGFSYWKNFFELNLAQNAKDFNALQTTKGRKEQQKKIKEFQKKASNKDFLKLTDSITYKSTPQELSKLRKAAKEMGMEKEFAVAYGEKLQKIRGSATKYDPAKPALSLTQRFAYSSLLKNHEMTKIMAFAGETDGLPQVEGEITPAIIGEWIKLNPEFAKIVQEYYANSEAQISAPTKKETKTEKTKSNKQDSKKDSASAVKKDIDGVTNNWSAWDLQAQQFGLEPTFDNGKYVYTQEEVAANALDQSEMDRLLQSSIIVGLTNTAKIKQEKPLEAFIRGNLSLDPFKADLKTIKARNEEWRATNGKRLADKQAAASAGGTVTKYYRTGIVDKVKKEILEKNYKAARRKHSKPDPNIPRPTEGREADTFSHEVDWDWLNQGNLKTGATLHVEYNADNPYNKRPETHYGDALYQFVHYIDGDVNNKVDTNRKVVGSLAAYYDTRAFITELSKQQLKALRLQLEAEVKASTTTTGIIPTSVTTKVARVRGGRIWQPKDGKYHGPADILREGDKLILAIGRRMKGQKKNYLDDNGTKFKDRIKDSWEIDLGRVYMLVPDNSGALVPIKLYTRKIGELPVTKDSNPVEEITAMFREFADLKPNEREKKNEILERINTRVYVKDVNYYKGEYRIDYGTIDETPKVERKKDFELADFIKGLTAQIHVSQINGGIYNRQISDEGLLTTDVKPYNYFHSSKVVIEPIVVANVKVTATDEDVLPPGAKIGDNLVSTAFEGEWERTANGRISKAIVGIADLTYLDAEGREFVKIQLDLDPKKATLKQIKERNLLWRSNQARVAAKKAKAPAKTPGRAVATGTPVAKPTKAPASDKDKNIAISNAITRATSKEDIRDTIGVFKFIKTVLNLDLLSAKWEDIKQANENWSFDQEHIDAEEALKAAAANVGAGIDADMQKLSAQLAAIGTEVPTGPVMSVNEIAKILEPLNQYEDDIRFKGIVQGVAWTLLWQQGVSKGDPVRLGYIGQPPKGRYTWENIQSALHETFSEKLADDVILEINNEMLDENHVPPVVRQEREAEAKKEVAAKIGDLKGVVVAKEVKTPGEFKKKKATTKKVTATETKVEIKPEQQNAGELIPKTKKRFVRAAGAGSVDISIVPETPSAGIIFPHIKGPYDPSKRGIYEIAGQFIVVYDPISDPEETTVVKSFKTLAQAQAAAEVYKKKIEASKPRLVTELESYTPLDRAGVEKWFARRLPGLSPDIVDYIIEIYKNGGAKAWGVFNAFGIKLFKGAPKGTEHHEAFHGVFNMILTRNQRAQLITEAMGRYNPPPDTWEGTINDYYEEKLADEFIRAVQQDMLNVAEMSPLSRIKRFFLSVWEFFKHMFSKDVDIESVFFRINSGVYRFSSLSEYTGEEKAKPAANPIDVGKNVQLINHTFFEVLEEYRNKNNLGDIDEADVVKHVDKNAEKGVFHLYENVLNSLMDAYDKFEVSNPATAEKLADIIDNFIITNDKGESIDVGDYYKRAVKDLRMFGIKLTEAQINQGTANDSQRDDAMYEVSEERNPLEGWHKDAIEQNGKESLSFKVKKTLRLALKYKIDDKGAFVPIRNIYGFEEFVEFDEIYNYLESKLANRFDSDVMFARMEELKYYRPDLYGILEKIKKDEKLRSSFFSNLAKSFTSHQQMKEQRIEVDEGYAGTSIKVRYDIYNANRKNLSQLILNEWDAGLRSFTRNDVTEPDGVINKGRANAYLREYEQIIKEINKRPDRSIVMHDSIRLADILNKFGMDNITAEALHREYRSKPYRQGNKTVQSDPYTDYMALMDGTRSLKNLIDKIAAGDNPYEGENAETTSAKKVAKTVSLNIEHLHQDTYINIDKKQVHAYLLPTFLDKRIQELKDENSRTGELKNWWFKYNKWLQDLNAENGVELLEQFDSTLIDGSHFYRRKSKSFIDMTDFELDVTDLNMYDNNRSPAYGWYRSPILADSSQAPYIKFRKYNQAEIIEGFYQLALAERDRIAMARATDIKLKNWNTPPADGEIPNGFKYQFVPIFNNPDIDIANKDQARKAIQAWLEAEIKLEQARLINNGVLGADGKFAKTISDKSANVKDYFRDYFYNKVFANAMMTQLFGVDLAFYKTHEDFQKRFAQIYKFTKMIDVRGTWKGFTVGETYKSIYIKDNIINSELANAFEADLIGKGYSKKYAKKQSDLFRKKKNKKGSGVNQTDAQTYITIDRYRRIQIGIGEWNDEKERVYKLVKAGKPYDPKLNILFNPIKPFYFGHQSVGNITVPVQHKNSEVVLLPSLVKDSPTLKKLLAFMDKNGIDSALFNSAVKVGEHGVAENVNDLKNATVHVMDNSLFGIQMETPDHHLDVKNLFGSQVRKLIISDLPNDFKIGNYTKAQIIKIYHDLIIANVQESYNRLSDDLSHFDKLQKLLLDEVVNRNLGEYYEIALEKKSSNYLGEDVFNLPLYHSVHAKRFENLLNAIVRNKVVKQKINGGSFALMSNFGFTENLKVVRDANGGIAHMEVMLPAWSREWFPRIVGGPRDGEVDIEAMEKYDSRVLDLFGYRIPTEHKYSMKKLKVVGFLPDAMGGAIMLPAEITRIAGEDFDIDKLYVMIPNIRAEFDWGTLQHEFNLENDFKTWRKANNYRGMPLTFIIHRIEDKLESETATSSEKRFYKRYQDFLERSKGKYFLGLKKIEYGVGSTFEALGDLMETPVDVTWAKSDPNGYEVSTKGDDRFSALRAKLNDGRTIEEAYQLDVKGYRKGELIEDTSTLKPGDEITDEDGDGFIVITDEEYAKEGGVSTDGIPTRIIFKGNTQLVVNDARDAVKSGGIIRLDTTSPLYKQNKSWKAGKGKAPLIPMTTEDSYGRYKNLWKAWSIQNPRQLEDLREQSKGKVLTDKFAKTDVSQARALAEILNETREQSYKNKLAAMTKKERDNAIMDIMKDIWSSPYISDQVMNPGGSSTLKELAIAKRKERGIDENANAILPRTQMAYFMGNTNGVKLVGLGANHNVNHAIAQFSDLALTREVLLNGGKLTKLNIQKARDGGLISRNIAEFLTAFVDNAKDPIAGDLNINTFTFDTVAMMIRLGYGLKEVTDFITQPIIEHYSRQFFIEGETKRAEREAYEDIKEILITGKKINVKEGTYEINTKSLKKPESNNLTTWSKEIAEQQLKVLMSFREYRKQAESLSKFVRATKADSSGTHKTMAGNTKGIMDMRDAMKDENLIGVNGVLVGDKYTLIRDITKIGLIDAQHKLLDPLFPYAKLGYEKLYLDLAANKGEPLTEDEINYVNNLTLVYYNTGFDFYNLNHRDKWINLYPATFEASKYDPVVEEEYDKGMFRYKTDHGIYFKIVEDNATNYYYRPNGRPASEEDNVITASTYNREKRGVTKSKFTKFAIMKYLKFTPKESKREKGNISKSKETEEDIDKVEFVSGATIGNEQRVNLQNSWAAMLASDDPEISKMGRDLVQYSFHTNGLTFTYGGFSHLIPTDYLAGLEDSQGINSRDYLYKLQEEAQHPDMFKDFIEQMFRHNVREHSLLPTVYDNKKGLINRKTRAGLIVSALVQKSQIDFGPDGEVLTKYIKINSAGRDRGYKFVGITSRGDHIYNVMEPLGIGANVYEYNILDQGTTSVIPTNKFIEFAEDDYYHSTEELNAGGEKYQVESAKELEQKFGIADEAGVHRSYGKDEKGTKAGREAFQKALAATLRINPELRDTGYRAIIAREPDKEGGADLVIKIVAEDKRQELYQLPKENAIEPNQRLNALLREQMAKAGVSIKDYDALKDRMGGDIAGMADLFLKLIKVSKGLENLDTLPEEVGHMAEGFNRGNRIHSRLMYLVINTPEYAQVVRDYSALYEGDETMLKQEAIGQLIGKHIIKRFEVGMATEDRPSSSLMLMLRELWNRFLAIFRKPSEYNIASEIEAITKKISADVLEGNFKSWKLDADLQGRYYQLSTATDEEVRDLMQSSIDSIYKKIKIYERKALASFTEHEEAVLENLTTALEENRHREGLLEYVINAKQELQKVVARYDKIVRDPETHEDQRNTIKTLYQMNNYVNGFKETLDNIAAAGILEGNTADEKLVNRFISDTATLTARLQTEYYRIGKPILAKMLQSFSTNPDADLGKALDVLETDINFFQRWLDELAKSPDAVANIMDKMVKEAKHTARIETVGLSKDIMQLQINLERAGIPSTHFMYERDHSGRLTGYVLGKYNMGEYDKRRREFFEQNPKPQEPVSKDIDVQTAYYEDLALWNASVGEWYKENTVPHPGKEEIMAAKEAEFKALHGDAKIYVKAKPGKPAGKVPLWEVKYNEWLGKNFIETTYFDTQRGEPVTEQKYIKELAIPNPAIYTNQVYEDMMTGTSPAQKAMRAYHEAITAHLKKLDDKLPVHYKLNGLAPQIRKDFFERLTVTDSTGNKSFKSLKEGWGEFKETLGENFVRHENDVEFGLTDENNDPVNMLPVRFTKKIKDVANLSLDMTSSIIAFAYSANDFSEMNKIIDVLEYTKDVVGERLVKTGKFDPVTTYKNVFSKGKNRKGKPIMMDGTDSMAYQRIVDWMNMTVYGQTKKDEKIGNVDLAKLADFVNSYTSITSLALNLYSGISNVTVGYAMTKMEAIAGEFVNNADMRFGDNTYRKEFGGLVKNIGQRQIDSKLELWIQYMDTLQNYDREYRNVDAGRKTVFSRLMKTSNLYFLNHAGEHLIQSRLSLALAHNTKVKDKNGKIMSLWDAFDVVGDRLVAKEGLTKVAGEKETHLFRKEEEGQPFTQKDVLRFINRQNFLNKRLHGIYNDIDKSAMQKYALGRMALMFRKFVRPGWNRRFEKWTYNEEGEVATEGYYATAGRFLAMMYRELKGVKETTGKNWRHLTEADKANFHRLMTEWAFILGSAAFGAILTNMGDDDEENYLLNLAAYEAYRMYSEIRFFTSINEIGRILRSPAASIYKVENLAKFLEFWAWDEEITRGKFKGFSKFERGVIQNLPLGPSIVNVVTPEEHMKFYTNNGIKWY